MSLLMPERLYQLLPALYRLRDVEQGEPLRTLLGVIENELERIEADTASLYDNWFIETCAEWVVPYIGELLGVRPLRPLDPANGAGVSARAWVANTIAYRRRKGTVVVLEQLARDSTGWPARAVEFFTRLATTEHLRHIRTAPTATPGIRDAARAELAGFAQGAFDPFAHTLEVRRAATRGGRHNIPNVGLFLWRLRSYAMGVGTPGDTGADFSSARHCGQWWSVHPAGCDTPLFNQARTETTITHLAEEDNVPGLLRGLVLQGELERLRHGIESPAPRFMTEVDPVLRVWVRQVSEAVPTEVRREDMYWCAIPAAAESQLPLARTMAFDPARGRLSFARWLDLAEVWVQASYGFSGDLGGGPYERAASVRAAGAQVLAGATDDGGFADPGVWQAGVSHLLPPDASGTLFASLPEALAAWNVQAPGRTGVIVLMDSLTEQAEAGGSPPLPLEVDIGEGSRLLIVAGQWPLEPIPGAPPGAFARVPGHVEARQVRAHVIGDWVIRGTAAAGSRNGGALYLNGVLLEGHVTVAPGNLGTLALAHCSVLPGRGALNVAAFGNEALTVTLDRTICAGIEVLAPIRKVVVRDSIVGSGAGSPAAGVDAAESALEVERSTCFGGVTALSLSASDAIFASPVLALRRQTGCVRFSYVAPGSNVPRRYRCQPEREGTLRIAALGPAPTAAQVAAIRAEVAGSVRPLFVSRDYGDPGFGQLALHCAPQIRTGAENGAEMGAFAFLQQPQREANLRDALDEYLRFGLEAGLHFVT